jgi:hypothetical protein
MGRIEAVCQGEQGSKKDQGITPTHHPAVYGLYSRVNLVVLVKFRRVRTNAGDDPARKEI